MFRKQTNKNKIQRFLSMLSREIIKENKEKTQAFWKII